MSLNKSIIEIRCELQSTKLKKSGQNKFAGFSYYELADFLPTLNQLMMKHEVNDLYSIDGSDATLTLIKGDEKQVYKMPFERFATPLNKNGTASMQDIQYLGALNTYYKRYLYLNAFGITDGEVIDAMDMTYAPAPSKAKTEDKTALLKKFKEICESYGVDTKSFVEGRLGAEVYEDKDKLYKEVRHYMNNFEHLTADLEAYKDLME